MSLSLPTVRKTKDSQVLPEPRPGDLARKRFPRKPVILAICALVLVGALCIIYMLHKDVTLPRVVVSIPECELIAIHTLGFVIARGGSSDFLGPDGSIYPVAGTYEHIITSGPWILGANPQSIALIHPTDPGPPPLTVRLAPGEKPVPLLEDDVLLTYRPQPETRFGEPWHLRAISPRGSVMWDNQIPYAPLFAQSNERYLIVAAVDISGGGNPWVLCLSKHTGEILWQQSLGAGAWRYLAVTPEGNIRAVLDSCAYCLTPEGQVAWAYRPAGTIVSAVASTDIVAVSVTKDVNAALSNLYGNAQVVVLGPGGDVLWDMKSMDELPRPFIVEGRLVVLESGGFSCFNVDTGEVLFSAKVDGYPIACAKDVILVYKDNGLVLVDAGISKP